MGSLDSERALQNNLKKKIGPCIIFYSNPITFLKCLLRNYTNSNKNPELKLLNPRLNFFLSAVLLFFYVGSLLITIPLTFISFFIFPWKIFVFFFKEMNIRKIYVGDALISSVLRSRFSAAAAEPSFRFVLTLAFYVTFLFIIFYFTKLLIEIQNFIGGKIYHWITDALYLNEAFRRLLSSKKSIEVRFGRNKYEFHHDYKSCLDLELMNNYINPDKAVCYEELSYSAAESLLNDIIDRKIETSLLTNGAFSKNIVSNYINVNKNSNNKSVVLFMHRFADAQFGFGVDDFLDLNEWQNETIKLCVDLGLNVYIRPHPEMLVSEESGYPSEARYLDQLSNKYAVDFDRLNSVFFLKTNAENIYFLSPFINLKEIKDSLGMYLSLTHHGSIAVETAFLGHNVIASEAGPYVIDVDTFIDFYSSKEKYAELIRQWCQKPINSGDGNLKPVLDFVLRNNKRYEIS